MSTVSEQQSSQSRPQNVRKDSLETIDSDGEDKLVDESNIEDLMRRIPQGSDKTNTALDQLLDTLPSRWRNWVIRVVFTVLMCSGFGLAMYYGPLPLIFLTLGVQVKCFQEIISIGYSVYRVHGLPWFRSLSWYMLIASNYFLFGERIIDVMTIVFKINWFAPLVTYHRFISFSLYIIGFVWFVLSLVKKYYLRQFSLFAWTHVTLLIVVSCSFLIIQNMFDGLIWFIVPVSIIVINDCMAYVFGFFFGRTPLIKLSPKKTWEGFIGGAISTILLGMMISHVFAGSKFFTCPIETYKAEEWNFDCNPSPLFQLTEYQIPEDLTVFFKIAGLPKTIVVYPFVLHSLSLSLFGAIIGPFGGFFASGFKRAFKIKDFGDIIPGHGGIVDRFDCQYLMAVFVNVYIASFIALPNPEKILRMILQLKAEEQSHVLEMLSSHLRPNSD